MEPIEVDCIDEIGNASILIEGLPGVGQVGKLVAEHLISELGAEKVAEIRSIFFPPQVLIDEDGVAALPKNEIYWYKGEEISILFLVGDFQSSSSEGHYLLSDAYLDIAEKFGVKRLYTLGGYGVGHLIDDSRVLAAVNAPSLRDEVEAAGATFPVDEPVGGIIGASGLLLGMSTYRDIEGVCLMGETSGYLVDPKSANNLLDVLSSLLGIEVDKTRILERAEEMEEIIEKLKDMEQSKKDEELSYIG